jgi:hypothetical protein
MTDTITKAGHELRVLERGPGRTLKPDPRDRQWTLLPCRCGVLVSTFTVPFRRHRCERCRGVYVTHPWARIEWSA